MFFALCKSELKKKCVQTNYFQFIITGAAYFLYYTLYKLYPAFIDYHQHSEMLHLRTM